MARVQIALIALLALGMSLCIGNTALAQAVSNTSLNAQLLVAARQSDLPRRLRELTAAPCCKARCTAGRSDCRAATSSCAFRLVLLTAWAIAVLPMHRLMPSASSAINAICRRGLAAVARSR